jgi:hypothetical protein
MKHAIRILVAASLAMLLLAASSPDAGPGDGLMLPPVPDGVPSQVEADPTFGVIGLVKALSTGASWLAVGFGLSLLVWLLRRIGRGAGFAQSDRGGALLVMVLALAGALGAALTAGAALDLTLIAGAVSAALMAVGGRQWLGRLLWPKDAPPWFPWLRDALVLPGKPPSAQALPRVTQGPPRRVEARHLTQQLEALNRDLAVCTLPHQLDRLPNMNREELREHIHHTAASSYDSWRAESNERDPLSGELLPEWESLPAERRRQWINAAIAALRAQL